MSAQTVEELRERVGGGDCPGDDGYEEARKVLQRDDRPPAGRDRS